jgi:ABC-type multidrug transport system fused ATPase/permease subunit
MGETLTDDASPASGDGAPPTRPFRLLLSFFTPHWVKLTAGTLLGLVATATSLWTPIVVERVVSLLGSGGSMSGPIIELGVLTVIGIAAMLVQWLMLGRLAENVVYEARALLVYRFFRGRVRDVMARPAGELVSRATSDTLLREATWSSFVGIINGAVGVVGTIILMGVIDPLLLSLTIGAIVLFGGIMAWRPARQGSSLEGGHEVRPIGCLDQLPREGLENDVVTGAEPAQQCRPRPVWQARGNLLKQLGGDQADLLSDVVVKGQGHHDLTVVRVAGGRADCLRQQRIAKPRGRALSQGHG